MCVTERTYESAHVSMYVYALCVRVGEGGLVRAPGGLAGRLQKLQPSATQQGVLDRTLEQMSPDLKPPNQLAFPSS